jgi:hypothetical protein
MRQEKFGLLLVSIFSLLSAGCVYPAPAFHRESVIEEPAADEAVMHAYVEMEDPWGLFPSNQRCTVTQVDGQDWSQSMRSKVANRIPLQPGLHWIRVEVDLLLASPWWVTFEVDAEGGHQYALTTALVGCTSLFGRGRDRIIPMVIKVDDIQHGETVETLKLEGICSNSKSAHSCRMDRDCNEGLSCVVAGETGFGMCGHPSEKLIESLAD